MSEPILSISLLGIMDVRLNGEPVTRFESHKARALLAYLAAEANRPHNRAALAGLLWPDWPEDAASKNLRHTLYSLRKLLQDATGFLTDRQSITFHIDPDVKVDTHNLERTLAQFLANPLSSEAVEKLEETMQDVRGVFLESFTLDDSPDYEAWILGRREHHQKQILQSLSLLADWYANAGQLERAALFARRQLDLEPWREKAHQQLMHALAQQGQRVQALAQYESLRQTLKKELDVEPSLELRRLYEQIRDGEIPAVRSSTQSGSASLQPASQPASPNHNLPIEFTPFIGRQQELAQVRDLLHRYRLVTLIGSGGVGKTRLSIQTAMKMIAEFADGIWYIELAAVTDPELVPQAVASVLGLREEPLQSLIDTIGSYLRSCETLLVLDNCEHLLDACSRLAENLLQKAPKLKLLTSSREPLGISSEITFRVPSLSIPDLRNFNAPEDLLNSEAVLLFIERVRGVLPTFEINEHNARSVAAICQRLDGIPLALELAAARLNMLTTKQLASRLDNAFRILTGGSRTALPRQQTLRATIDWSYQLLSRQEQTLLNRLAVFAGEGSLEAIETICGGDGLEIELILDLLSGLVKKSMVGVERNQQEETRYRLLETVRQYAREKLNEARGSEALRDRHAAYYLGMAEQYAESFNRADEIAWQRKLEINLANLRAALDWSLDSSETQRGCAVVLALWDVHYWLIAGEVEEWRARLDKVASLIDPKQPSLNLARLWMHQGFFLEHQGLHTDAFALLQSSRAMFAAVGARLDYAKATQRLGLAAKSIGERSAAWENASSYFKESAAVFRELGADNFLAYVLNFWGNFEWQFSANYDLALELLSETELLYHKLGTNRNTNGIQGAIYLAMGQTQRARGLLETHLQDVRAEANQYFLMYALLELIKLELSEAELPAGLFKAQPVLRECFDLGRKFSGSLRDIYWGIFQYTEHAQIQKEYGLAREWYTAALVSFKQLAPVYQKVNRNAAGKCLLGLAQVAASQAHPLRCARLLGALDSLKETGADLWMYINPDEFNQACQTVQSLLNEAAFQQAWQQGAVLPFEQAISLAIEEYSE